MANKQNLPGKPYSQADLDAVSDNPEWTAEDFAAARPFAEISPELAETLRRQAREQAKQKGESLQDEVAGEP